MSYLVSGIKEFLGPTVIQNDNTADTPLTIKNDLGVSKFTVSNAGNVTVSGTLAVTGATTTTGAQTFTGGVVAGGTPTTWNTGQHAPGSTTVGTDTTPSVTETYIAEVFIPVNTTITGVAFLSGSANAGNVAVALASSAGAILASSASTATTGTAAFQQVPFSSTYAAVGPAKYFVLLQNSSTSNRFRSHILGNFGASKKTGEVFATFTTITPPTTFTTGQGPIASTY